MITVFYDGKCDLCSKEIRYYRKIAPNNVFNWQDITESDQQLKQIGATLAEGLKYLHATDHQQRLHIGVDAFILIWQQLKGWKILAKLVSLPLCYQVATLAYRLFAQWRFNKNDHCRIEP